MGSQSRDTAARIDIYAVGGLPMTPDINGGTIDGTPIGGTTRAAGAFTTLGANSTSTLAAVTCTTLSASGQITSTVTTGTAPLVIASTTNVPNLNASLLLGGTWAIPGSIGSTTPAAGAFTTLSSSGLATLDSLSVTNAAGVTGVLTASNASNVIRIGTSCNMTTPPAIGGTTPNTGAFTTISATGQITSTLSTGTAPFVVASTTVVANLNCSQLLGGTWAIPGTIGSTTPNTGAFTTGSFTGTLSANTLALVSGTTATLYAAATTVDIGASSASTTTLGASGSTLTIGSQMQFNGGGANDIRAFGGRNLVLRLGSTAGSNILDIRDAGYTSQSSCSDIGVWTTKGLINNGNATLGNASTQTITCTGRLIVRSVTDSGPMTATGGTQREIVFNTSDSKFYGCTVTHASAATWSALN